MRAFVHVGLAFLLCGCLARNIDASIKLTAPTEKFGAWRVQHAVDRITGEPTPKALIETAKTSYTKSDTAWPATIALTCYQRRPIIRFVFDHKIGSNSNSTFAYRLDDKPGREPDATILPDYKTIVIDDGADVAQFMDELASSTTLLVRVNSIFAGRSTAEFRVEGAGPAVAAVMTACPLPSPAPRPAAKPAKRAAVGTVLE
jgi:hypothetical protein